MKLHIPLTIALLLAGGNLFAQAPADTASAPKELTLGQRLKALDGEIERLQAEYRNREALKAVEAILPATKPEFDGKNARAAHNSFIKYLDLTSAYIRAYLLAHSAGDWEKALGYATKASEIAKENYKLTKDSITPVVDYYKNVSKQAQAVLDESAARIKELKAKINRDPGEQQELDLAMGVEREVTDGEKWAKTFQNDIDLAKYHSERYDVYVENERAAIKALDDAISGYKAGKGDKAKFVEAVMAYPKKLVEQFPGKKERVEYLYRLLVLAPNNKKVDKEIDALIAGAKR